MGQFRRFMLPTEYWKAGAMGTRRVRGGALLVTAAALGLAVGCSNGGAGGAANASQVEDRS